MPRRSPRPSRRRCATRSSDRRDARRGRRSWGPMRPGAAWRSSWNIGTVTVAALFDTTVAVLLLRREPRADAAELLEAARAEIAGGGALLPAVAVAELVVGERTAAGVNDLAGALARLPAAILPVEAAVDAGTMGSFLVSEGAQVPFPDLLVATTAIWLDVPLLTWDGDFARARRVATRSRGDHPGARLWRRLRLHPASREASTAG